MFPSPWNKGGGRYLEETEKFRQLLFDILPPYSELLLVFQEYFEIAIFSEMS